jgi:AcrR family transcriptional regulator
MTSSSSRTPPPCQPRWQRRPQARPEEILDAALEVFGEQGFARAKLEDVARRAGVSKGTLYLYFDSKEALFRELVRVRVAAVVLAGEELVRQHQGSFRSLLLRLAHRTWDTVNDPGAAKIIRLVHSERGNFPELTKFYFNEVVLRARPLVQNTIERGIAAGEFRPINPVVAARALSLLLVHLSQYQHYLQAFDPDRLPDAQVAEAAIDLYLNGLLNTGKPEEIV